ncbi:MAG: hypothetical protein Q9222_000900 [Ikaeria aurantiellina]
MPENSEPRIVKPSNKFSANEDPTVSQSETSLVSDANSSDEDIAAISFSALVKAQESLGTRTFTENDSIHSRGCRSPVKGVKDAEPLRGQRTGKSHDQMHVRSSKHAPAEMSSKKAVSRKREVVPTTKRDVRDPRFEPISGAYDEEKVKANYSFLDDYRTTEMSDLKASIRRTNDEVVREKLKQALTSMESRKRTMQRRDQQQEVLSAHRAKEKELIKQGKRPFHLKRSEQKRLALVQRFESMNDKQRDKTIERRRKKKARKVIKEMPERVTAHDV